MKNTKSIIIDIEEEYRKHITEKQNYPLDLKNCLLFMYSSTIDSICLLDGKYIDNSKMNKHIKLMTNLENLLDVKINMEEADNCLFFGVEEFNKRHPKSGLNEFSDYLFVRVSPFRHILMMEYIMFYLNNPYLEQLVKVGFENILKSLFDNFIPGYTKDKNQLNAILLDFKKEFQNGTDIQSICRLQNNQWKVIVKYAKDIYEWIALKKMMTEYGINSVYVERFCQLSPKDVSSLLEKTEKVLNYKDTKKNKYYSFYTLLNYLEKVTIRQGLKPLEAIRLMDDYYRMCEELSIDGKTKSENLQRDHDVLAVTYLELKNKKEFEFYNEGFKKQNEKLQKYIYTDERLEVVIPEKAEDLLIEGKRNHNCVASYIERHAKGETNILFIRKKTQPETSYITVELGNDNKIKQAYYSYNREISNRKDCNFIESWVTKCVKKGELHA